MLRRATLSFAITVLHVTLPLLYNAFLRLYRASLCHAFALPRYTPPLHYKTVPSNAIA